MNRFIIPLLLVGCQEYNIHDKSVMAGRVHDSGVAVTESDAPSEIPREMDDTGDEGVNESPPPDPPDVDTGLPPVEEPPPVEDPPEESPPAVEEPPEEEPPAVEDPPEEEPPGEEPPPLEESPPVEAPPEEELPPLAEDPPPEELPPPVEEEPPPEELPPPVEEEPPEEEPPPVEEPPPAEVCDGEDNDGDGLVDEGFPDSDADGIVDCLEREYTIEWSITVDDAYSAWVDGEPLVFESHGWNVLDEHTFVLDSGEHVLAVHGWDTGLAISGHLSALWVDGYLMSTTGDGTWRVRTDDAPTGWTLIGFDDSGWTTGVRCADTGPWSSFSPTIMDLGALWTWYDPAGDCRAPSSYGDAYYRLVFWLPPA